MNRLASHVSGTHQNIDRAMEPEQFTQVIEAILDGKYSWACVLILRFAGYNPLHYIPYRTYNRLVKDNLQSNSRSDNHQVSNQNQKTQKEFIKTINQDVALDANQKMSHQIKDLAYVESTSERCQIRGGRWFIGAA